MVIALIILYAFKMLISAQTVGKDVENIVRTYLQQQGLKFIATNYFCKCGEIDLIMDDNNTLVFIEVRYRMFLNYGDGVASVNHNKRDRIKRAAVHYLQKHNLYDKVICRFDIVAVSGVMREEIAWIRDAFWAKW